MTCQSKIIDLLGFTRGRRPIRAVVRQSGEFFVTSVTSSRVARGCLFYGV